MASIECFACGKEIEYPRDGNKIAIFDDGYSFICPTCSHIIRVYTDEKGIITDTNQVG